MKTTEKPGKTEDENTGNKTPTNPNDEETGESREQLSKKIDTLISKVELLEEEKDEMGKKLVEFEDTIDKLVGELEVKNLPKPIPLSPEAKFRKDHPKKKYMVKHSINHGEVVNGKNKTIILEVGQPFPESEKVLLDKFRQSGQVVQIA